MLISQIGEFGLIERFRRSIKADSSVIKGSGDDCAVLEFDKDYYQLFTCDMIVEGVDFTAKDNLSLVGRKALAVSISDIAACGGIPKYAVVSLGLPKNSTVEYADKIAKGLFHLAKEYKINIVGGDISRAGELTIDVSMLGMVKKNKLVLRDGAKIGDIIMVTGEIGGSYSGKHLKFIPRVKESRFLVENFKINSMIDVSDGLIQDLGHILKQSNAGAVIYEAFIPISKTEKRLSNALSRGEDFELLFTASRHEAKKILEKDPVNFKAIGEIVSKKQGFKLIDKNNKQINLVSKGYQHFK
ncbi:MAG: thiamine-phosphate kinase [Candidatus Omnitrophota bacterium]